MKEKNHQKKRWDFNRVSNVIVTYIHMTQEDKELLFKDLCVRLPYNCKVFYEYIDNLDNKTYGYSLTLNTWCIDEFIANKAVIKPYLRPMSSMTEKEFESLKEYTDLKYDQLELIDWNNTYKTIEFYLEEIPHYCVIKVFDWLNAHHFDYRGLIERGLAIEITKENNPHK